MGGAEVIVVGPEGVTLDELLSAPVAPLPLAGARRPLRAVLHRRHHRPAQRGRPPALKSDGLLLRRRGACGRLPLDAERILNVAPLFHIWGFCYTLIFPVYLRAFMDLLPAYKPAAVLEEFQKRRITTFAGGPAALYMGLRANENFSRTDFSSLRVCLSGGAACPVELIRFWESATGAVLLEGWGMSEGAPIHQNPLHGVRKVGSVGLAGGRL